MNKEEFREFLGKGIVLLDGATGSNLQKRGMPSGICVEKWVCEHEQILIDLQREYIEAGSNVVYASTFAANRIKLKEFGLENEAAELNRQLVAISKKAAQGRALVAGDVTMTGQQLEPLGSLKLEELIDAYKEQMKALEEAGADFLAVETMMSLQETRAALLAAKEAVNLPVLVTMSFGEDGRTLYGTDAKTAAIVLDGLGADAVGINCSAGPDKMLPIVQAMREVTGLPIVAKPNAGLPKLGENGVTEYDMGAEEFNQHMEALVEAGASVLGGCCGTDPDYIRGIKEKVSDWTMKDRTNVLDKTYLTSERNALEWNPDCTVGFVSSKEDEELAEEWSEEIYDTMYDTIDECDDDEVDVLCICVDGTEGNLEKIMEQVVREAVSYTPRPIIFRSKDVKVLEAALRNYPGRSGVFADGVEEEECQRLRRIYGAAQMVMLNGSLSVRGE